MWFDPSELRGGDARDLAIRKQIKSRALFMPIISVNAHARTEAGLKRGHAMNGGGLAADQRPQGWAAITEISILYSGPASFALSTVARAGVEPGATH